jgi:hypothetical protein
MTTLSAAGNAAGELRKAEAEIARWEAFLAGHSDNEGAKRLLGWELEHAERVRAFLAGCGVRP